MTSDVAQQEEDKEEARVTLLTVACTRRDASCQCWRRCLTSCQARQDFDAAGGVMVDALDRSVRSDQ